MALLPRFQGALISRLRQAIEMAGMDYQIIDDPNESLAEPLYWGLKQSGYDPSTAFEVSEADFTSVDTADYTQVLDLAEFRLLTTILNNITATDERLGPHGKWGSQYPTRLQRRQERLEKKIAETYGIDLGTIEHDVLQVYVNDDSL